MPRRANGSNCRSTCWNSCCGLRDSTDGQGWVSEGWWNLKSNACEVLLRGPLAAQFYYVYAMDERGGEWKGKAFMCTRDRAKLGALAAPLWLTLVAGLMAALIIALNVKLLYDVLLG